MGNVAVFGNTMICQFGWCSNRNQKFLCPLYFDVKGKGFGNDL